MRDFVDAIFVLHDHKQSSTECELGASIAMEREQDWAMAVVGVMAVVCRQRITDVNSATELF